MIKLEIGSYLRPCFGERLLGDAILTSNIEELTYLAIIDAIGHGPNAELIARKIKLYLTNNLSSNPSELISKLHSHMNGTEGAVIGIAVVNNADGKFTFAGLGNTTCKVIGVQSKQLVSADGLLGVRIRHIKNTTIKLKNEDIIIMHSDGVSSSSNIIDLPRFRSLPPRLLAKTIISNYGNNFDDACCIAVKCILK